MAISEEAQRNHDMLSPNLLRPENAEAAAKVLGDAGFEVSTATIDVSSRESVRALVQTATALGDVTGVIHAARVSPTQASPATLLKVDLQAAPRPPLAQDRRTGRLGARCASVSSVQARSAAPWDGCG